MEGEREEDVIVKGRPAMWIKWGGVLLQKDKLEEHRRGEKRKENKIGESEKKSKGKVTNWDLKQRERGGWRE